MLHRLQDTPAAGQSGAPRWVKEKGKLVTPGVQHFRPGFDGGLSCYWLVVTLLLSTEANFDSSVSLIGLAIMAYSLPSFPMFCVRAGPNRTANAVMPQDQ